MVNERGFALVTALVFLVILTLLGVSMMSGTGLQTKMASNTQQKQLAFEAAQATLKTVIATLPTRSLALTSCTGSGSGTGWRVCKQNMLKTLTSQIIVQNATWGLSGGSGRGIPYSALLVPPASSPFPVNAAGGINAYYHEPEFLVTYAGQGRMPPGSSLSARHHGSIAAFVNIYQIDTMGTGGTVSAVAILQSYYRLMTMR